MRGGSPALWRRLSLRSRSLWLAAVAFSGPSRSSLVGQLSVPCACTALRKGTVMAFTPGDRVLAEVESTEQTARRGVIEEVVHDDPHPRYRIRWDDGHESIYTPADGALKPDHAASRSP
jgi:hypothetical protein